MIRTKNLSISTDEQLVGYFIHGDDRAFTVLYERYVRFVTAVVGHYSNGYVSKDDLVQDIFVHVSKKLKTVYKTKNFKSWLQSVAHNFCIDVLRSQKSILRRLSDASFFPSQYCPIDDEVLFLLGEHPAIEKDKKDELEAIKDDIREAIRCLPDDCRDVIMLRFYGNVLHKDIVPAMQYPSINNSTTTARRARLGLEKILIACKKQHYANYAA